MTHIRVSLDTREKLNILREDVMAKESVDEVIINLMNARSYTAEFFKQIREKVVET